VHHMARKTGGQLPSRLDSDKIPYGSRTQDGPRSGWELAVNAASIEVLCQFVAFSLIIRMNSNNFLIWVVYGKYR
jgi:hypothetical protein